MKKRFYPYCLLALTLFSACNKEDISNTDDKVGRSEVTHFASLTLKGKRYETVAVGTAYAEAGAEAKEAGQTITYTTAGSVNTAVPGVYTLSYTAVNKDGFATSQTRTVAVYQTDNTAAANDFSGTYLRPATGVYSYWTKLAPGVYKVDNPGGAASGESLSVIVFNPTGLTIKIPSQKSNDGNISSSSSETYSVAPSPAKYSWIFHNPGYGNSLRTFVKQ